MNNDMSRRLCISVIAVLAISFVSAMPARGDELNEPAASNQHDQAAASQRGLISVDPGDGSLNVMSRLELSQVASDKVVSQRQGNGRNEVRLPAENSSAEDARVRFDEATGFLIVDFRQSTGTANNQVNSAQIHVP